MGVFAVMLSFALVETDVMAAAARERGEGFGFGFGPAGARAVLSAIASSMITVAGLTFSITMLTLQLASAQFGPRMLRNFMRDRGNQMVLGTFIATFVYCLLVLRSVRGTETAHFVPQISVAFGIVLAVASLAVLIYFIHHIAVSIRIETVLAVLAGETREAIDRLYPQERTGEPDRSDEGEVTVRADFDKRALPVLSAKSGYVQSIDYDTLVRIARECGLVLRVETLPGSFVAERDRILSVIGDDETLKKAEKRLQGTLILGPFRTPVQDLDYSIRRIVEIAQRALSPGVNDPTTALYCIDRLGEALARLAARAMPSPFHMDEDGRLRVISRKTPFDLIACPAFAAIARYGLGDHEVIVHLSGAMDRVCNAADPFCATKILALKDRIRAQSGELERPDRHGKAAARQAPAR